MNRAMTVLLAVSALSVMSGKALAYIDPGTTGSLFGLLAPLFSLLAVFAGFLLWPFRKAFRAWFGKSDKTSATDAADRKGPPEE